MFHRALHNFDSNPSTKPPTKPASLPLTQSSKQPSIQNAFAGKPTPAIGHKLHAAASCGSGDGRITGTTSASRKRSYDECNRLATAFDSSQSFRENIPPTDDKPVEDKMDALSQAVYFEPDDFEDDDALVFDISEPVVYPSLHAVAGLVTPASTEASRLSTSSSETVSSLSHRRDSHTAKEPPSSAPLPWSSSPVEHEMAFRATVPTAKLSVQEYAYKADDPLEAHQRPPKKPRPLPWAKKETVAESTSEATAVKAQSRRTRESKDRKDRKDSRGRTQPWTDSFTDIKAAQKELRKQNTSRRSMSTLSSALKGPLAAKKRQERPAKVFFTEEQRHVLDLVLKGQNVFFTGSAGTGKSVLLREIISSLKTKAKRDPDRIAVTASTGLAACNVGGVTLHSFAGIGLGKESAEELITKIRKNTKARNRWLRTQVLIMDEISMVDGEMFDKLEEIARRIRGDGRPFGGLKLVITGDFFQLPPVPDRGRVAKFAFEAETWATSIEHTIGLTQVFRQRDPEFARMLDEMRLGVLTKETITTFRGLSRPVNYEDNLSATELFSTRAEVDTANNVRMRQLEGSSIVYAAEDSGTITNKEQRDKLLGNCIAPATIELKVGAQVLLTKNMDDTLVNGSLGVVVGFATERMYEDMGDKDGVPSTSSLREDRQRILNMAAKGGAGIDSARRWPLVEFHLLDGTTRQLLCQPELWKVELPSGEIQAQRSQIPLILAWALSIHKAQGQTLERVKVDLGRVFEKGQAYVALSRAVSKDQLQVLRFEPKKVMAHEKVRDFYASLYSPAAAAEEAKRSAPSQQLSSSSSSSRSDTPVNTLPQGRSGSLDFLGGEDEMGAPPPPH